jgi:pyrroline-5-carboxylate reductase
MGLDDVAARGLVLLGCGRMGTALLRGWLAGGLPAGAVHVREPRPSDWLAGSGVAVNGPMPQAPAVAVVAVKPQVMAEALPALAALGGGRTLVLSIAAGTSLAAFEAVLGAGTPVVRAMPNTPAAVGRGISAIVGNAAASAAHLDLAEALMGAVGEVVRLGGEGQMDAVTAVSGSGPAYVFHLIEALAAAGEAEGLAPALALRLARATVAGAGALAQETGEDPGQLRRDVTSPNGTTQAGLEVLMAELPGLIRRTVAAAAARSRELGRA